jgi:hypothetical protein
LYDIKSKLEEKILLIVLSLVLVLSLVYVSVESSASTPAVETTPPSSTPDPMPELAPSPEPTPTSEPTPTPTPVPSVFADNVYKINVAENTAYDYVTTCYNDPSFNTVGKVTVSEYRLIEGDETHLPKSEYEWRLVKLPLNIAMKTPGSMGKIPVWNRLTTTQAVFYQRNLKLM